MTSGWLTIQGLTVKFGGVVALNGASIDIGKGEIVGLIGPNGAGKTTLFNVLSGFVRPEAGSIALAGQSIADLRPHVVARRGVARTFQDLRLIQGLTALENVLLSFPDQPGEDIAALPFRFAIARLTEAANRKAARVLLERAGIGPTANQPAGELSYGQQKLLTLACAMARNATLLLLDEPIAGVAPALARQTLDVILELNREGRTIILIEHDMVFVRAACHRVILLQSGMVVASGHPDDDTLPVKLAQAYLD
jgi:ABC-type branched-subunit amino acid transport system ATPase component